MSKRFAVGAICVALLSQMGLDPWNAEESEHWLRREQERSDDLDRRHSCILSHEKIKEKITNELVEGRLTLLDAARIFLPVQRRAEQCGARVAVALIDLPEEERVCRTLIDWIETSFCLERSDRSEMVVAHLRSELEEHLLAGPLHLTD